MILTAPAVSINIEATVNPANVATSPALSTQTFTVAGVLPEHVFITGQVAAWLTDGFAVVGASCTTAGTLKLTFLNVTGGAYDAASATLKIVAL